MLPLSAVLTKSVKSDVFIIKIFLKLIKELPSF